ncbi:hypothetical protein LCGC14_1590580 [marine sediment metagenome]|uniref:Uncharacterized protein n=1 Tax=marine sediment metagenome TaxID=412755 RepID=A0A0F9LEJ9_9ZZZZ
MCDTSARVRIREFERDWYRKALVALQEQLGVLADEKEDQPHNAVWMLACDALDRRRLAEAAAEAGLLTDLFEAEE